MSINNNNLTQLINDKNMNNKNINIKIITPQQRKIKDFSCLKNYVDIKIFLYQILFLYNCFLDGWKIQINDGKVKLKINNTSYNSINNTINNYNKDNYEYNSCDSKDNNGAKGIKNKFNIDEFIINNYLY